MNQVHGSVRPIPTTHFVLDSIPLTRMFLVRIGQRFAGENKQALVAAPATLGLEAVLKVFSTSAADSYIASSA